MAVDNETVKHVAFLSRLRVDESNVEETKQEFNKILDWVAELSEVNTDGIEPLVSVHTEPNEPREDVVTAKDMNDVVLANAPQKEFGYFVVPKVVE
jgi:aspartyl-tRNA(Asn)/glutamyl-tRNA(Gln) amidotransferase subunit C